MIVSKRIAILLVGITIHFFPVLSLAETLDVCSTGCTYATIQSAINIAVSGDTVRVAQGVYRETLTISKSIELQGGWDNTFTSRVIEPSLSTIDAQGNNNVVIINGNSATDINVKIDCFSIINGQAEDGAGIKVTANNASIHATLNNNIISGNTATWGGGVAVVAENSGNLIVDFTDNQILSNFATYGGGIAFNVDNSSSAQMFSTNNKIMSNEADKWNNNSFGGALYLNPVGEGTLTFNSINDEFSSNRAGGDGGAIAVYATDNATISLIMNNSAIDDNSSGFKGGGIYFLLTNASSDLSIINTNISNNSCNQGIPAGAGIYIKSQGELNLNFMENTISNNGAGNGGGGGIAVLTSTQNSLINMVGNVISNNGGLSSGGGIYIDNSTVLTLDIVDNEILSNQIANNGLGGGIYLKNSNQLSAQMINNLVVNNGSGYLFGGTNDDFNGGGIAFIDNGNSELRFFNNTITANFTNSAIYIESSSGNTQVAFTNDIIYANRHKDLFNKSNSASITIAYSDIGVTYGNYIDTGFNINTDPLFVGNGNYHLTESSPCINVGTAEMAPENDIDGDTRPQGVGYDMGADEYIGASLFADFNASPMFGTAPLEVTFTDASIGDIISWEWDFGDGESSTERNPAHTYNFIGTYTVKLIVTISGTTYTKIKSGYITVNATTVSGKVAIKIAGHSDLPVINATVYIEGTTYTTATSASGNFTFENVPAGTYTVIATAPNLVPLSQQITVPEGQNKIIDLPLMRVLTQDELNQAVADAEASKDLIIAEKDQIISDLNTTILSMFTQEQMDYAVLNERQKWDIGGDSKISLLEAIHALQVVSGIQTE